MKTTVAYSSASPTWDEWSNRSQQSARQEDVTYAYADEIPYDYDQGRHDGTMAGLLIGAVSGAIVTLLFSLMM